MSAPKNFIVGGIMACALFGCNAADIPQTRTDDVVEIAVNDVPADVVQVVMESSADFKMSEVLKKRRDGRTYYDVEGALPNGDEIEFDVLITESGPKIVEIQRDILWETTPVTVRDIVREANFDNLEIARVIESKQAGTDTIIYEVFVQEHPKTPHFEVSVSGENITELLTEPAKH